MQPIDITKPSPDYGARHQAAIAWLNDPEQAGDAYEIASDFGGRYADDFWVDVDTIFEAAREDGGPLSAPAGVHAVHLGRLRDGDGDTYGVVIRIEMDSGLTLATSTMSSEDLVTRSEGPDARGILAAAEVLATLQYETEKVLRDYQATRSDAAERLAGQALAELESGAVKDGADQAFLDGVRQTAVYLATATAVPGSDLAALLNRMRQVETDQ